MIKDNRKTSKLAIAGLIFAVAEPCLCFLMIFPADGHNEILNEIINVLSNSLAIIPLIAIFLSIAGIVVSIKKDKKGVIPGIIGLILSIAEILILILSISSFLTRMQQYTPI